MERHARKLYEPVCGDGAVGPWDWQEKSAGSSSVGSFAFAFAGNRAKELGWLVRPGNGQQQLIAAGSEAEKVGS